ncbi:MAG: 16S rRNA (guanine(527)-N(7))-methyltransferase RsmG [Acidobacteriota bacterium]|nr:16S rRNA (guanine(527)-N(7))-methyltransferase RsmG [Acidobacteriota bacterium]
MTDDRLELYRRELLAWNEKINLIGPEAKANIEEHIAEALEGAAILEPQRDVLDFGSGGGFPGIPMAIVSPSARFHLVESDKKKWAFLKHVVRECRLNSVVYGDRLTSVLTQFSPELRFSLVTSRAVGSPQAWLPALAPFMEVGGRAALFQAAADAVEIAHFRAGEAHKLRRGYLVMFHVEQA